MLPRPTSRSLSVVGAAAAGSGHVLLAPDYIGLGVSEEPHPYLHTASTVSACIDMLHAGRALLRHLGYDWPPQLYLTGFSQGGHAVLAVQQGLQRLEDPELQVKASATIAGPFHLRSVPCSFKV